MSSNSFHFRQFTIRHEKCAMKVGTDGVLLGSWARGGKRILDIGTGSGLIALMMAQRFTDANITGIDIDEDACSQAVQNVELSPFADRVEIVKSSFQDFARMGVMFDSVVSNPPFFVGGMRNPDHKRTIARHTDTLTFRDLFSGTKSVMTEDGTFSVIVPALVMNDVVSEAYVFGFYIRRKVLISTNNVKPPKRCLLEFSLRHIPYDEQRMAMFDADGSKSRWYGGLTGQFYLK